MALPPVASSWTSTYSEEEFPMDDVSDEMSVELRELRLRFMLPAPNTPRPPSFKTLPVNDIIALLSSGYRNVFFYSDLTTAALVISDTANERSDPSSANANDTS